MSCVQIAKPPPPSPPVLCGAWAPGWARELRLGNLLVHDACVGGVERRQAVQHLEAAGRHHSTTGCACVLRCAGPGWAGLCLSCCGICSLRGARMVAAHRARREGVCGRTRAGEGAGAQAPRASAHRRRWVGGCAGATHSSVPMAHQSTALPCVLSPSFSTSGARYSGVPQKVSAPIDERSNAPPGPIHDTAGTVGWQCGSHCATTGCYGGSATNATASSSVTKLRLHELTSPAAPTHTAAAPTHTAAG